MEVSLRKINYISCTGVISSNEDTIANLSSHFLGSDKITIDLDYNQVSKCTLFFNYQEGIDPWQEMK